MMRNKLYTIGLFVFSALVGNAQEIEVKATVLDANNKPIEGAVIVVKDVLYEPVLTDKQGNARFTIEKGKVATVCIFNEYEKTVVVDNPSLVVKMDKNAKEIQLGYISTLKNISTGSVSTVTHEDLSISGQVNPEFALYGLLPGLTVQQNWTLPSYEGPKFQLRGRSPLVIVDGFERPMNTLSREEIESVSVIKDAAALAMYGMRGSNGVISVTTKRGSNKSMDIKVDYHHGITTPVRLPELADAATYADALNEALANDGLPARYSSYDITDFRSGGHPYLYPNVDWWGETLRKHGSTNELNIYKI